jgi:hypothetical protein
MLINMSDAYEAYKRGELDIFHFESDNQLDSIHAYCVRVETIGSISICIFSYFLYEKLSKTRSRTRSIIISALSALGLFALFISLPPVSTHLRLLNAFDETYSPLFSLGMSKKTLHRIFV